MIAADEFPLPFDADESARARGAAAPLLLGRHVRLETSDLDCARHHVSGVFAPHQVSFCGRSQTLAFRHASAGFGNLSFNVIKYGADVVIGAPALEGFYLVQFTLNGCCEVREAGKSEKLLLEHGTINVIDPRRPYTKRWSADGRQLILRVNRRAVEAFVAETIGEGLAPVFSRKPVPFAAQTRSLVRLVKTVCEDLDDRDAGFANPAVQRQLEKSLIALILETLPHDSSEILDQATSRATPAMIRRAEAFIRAHAAAAIGLDEIAHAAGASARSLQAGFRRFRDTTPTAFVRAVRLEAARRALANGNGSSVTDIALENGFGHLGKFARVYKERFGETPSETWRRGRESAPREQKASDSHRMAAKLEPRSTIPRGVTGS